jgi:hypothetical protein
MNRYKKGITLENHSLDQIYERYKSRVETEFVKNFFQTEEIISILESCGFSPPSEILTEPEFTVQIGHSKKRADLIFEHENSVFYFEVMSQGGGGKWDDAHHEQFYLKSTRLSQIYENVYSFAISFKEFEPCYLEEIQAMDNWFAIHLRFNDSGYFVDVYGVEEKKKKQTFKNLEKEEIGSRWLGVAKEFGYKNRKEETIFSNYLYIGKGYKSNKWKGIEWVLSSKDDRMGIKLTGTVYKEEPYFSINADPERVMQEVLNDIPEVNFIRTNKGSVDKTYYFEFDKEDFSEENKQKIKRITESFAKVFGLSYLLE